MCSVSNHSSFSDGQDNQERGNKFYLASPLPLALALLLPVPQLGKGCAAAPISCHGCQVLLVMLGLQEALGQGPFTPARVLFVTPFTAKINFLVF